MTYPMMVDREEFRDLVAKAVHKGWFDWLSGQGWRYGPERDPEKKTHPHLKLWNAMSEDDLESTYAAADSIVESLVEFGLITLGKVVKGE